MDQSQIVINNCGIGIECQCPLKIGNRLGVTFLLKVQHAAVEGGGGEGGIESQSVIIIGQGLFLAPLSGMSQGAIEKATRGLR